MLALVVRFFAAKDATAVFLRSLSRLRRNFY